MKKEFSTAWKASKAPRKQRKYKYNAPLHIKGKFLNAKLSEALVAKHKVKTIRVKLGDKVKVMRGKFKGLEGKVEILNLKTSKIKMTGAEVTKKDGSKAKMPIHASNVMIVELNAGDKRRLPTNKQ